MYVLDKYIMLLIYFLSCLFHIGNSMNSMSFEKGINKLNIKSMQFNLQKDSLWLSFPLKTTSFKDLSKKIPNTHRLSKCKIFNEDNYDYRLFFNCFDVKTSFFTGSRLEVVTITKNIINNKPSFVILDCFTNVMSWDPIDGIQNANCNIDKINTNTKYNILINEKKSEIGKDTVNENDENYENDNNDEKKFFDLISFKSKIQKTVLKDFSIEPNYLCYFKNYNIGYKLLFNENQIDKKVILLKDITLNHNIYENYIKELEHSFIYPQEMNFKVIL